MRIGERKVVINEEEVNFRFDFNARRIMALNAGQPIALEGDFSDEEKEQMLEESAKQLQGIDVFSAYEQLPAFLRAGLESSTNKKWSEEEIEELIFNNDDAVSLMMEAVAEGLVLQEKKTAMMLKMATSKLKATRPNP